MKFSLKEKIPGKEKDIMLLMLVPFRYFSEPFIFHLVSVVPAIEVTSVINLTRSWKFVYQIYPPPIDTLVTGMVPAAGVHWETMGGSIRIGLKSLDPDRQQRGRDCLSKDAQIFGKKGIRVRVRVAGVGVCLTLKPDEIATGVTVNKNHPFWVKTHFRYFKSWIGANFLLFYHSFCPFVFSVEKVRRLEKKVRYRGSAGSD